MSATRFILLLAVALTTACSPKPEPVTTAAPLRCGGQPHQIVARLVDGKMVTSFNCPDGTSEVGQ